MDLFTKYPLRLIIHDRFGGVQKQVIYIGNVPDEVRENLQKFIKQNKYDKQVIEDYYGQGWIKRLGLAQKVGGGEQQNKSSKDFDFDGPGDAEFNFDELFTPKPVEQVKQNDQKDKKDKNEDKKEKHRKEDKQKEAEIILGTSVLFPHDKISEFKLKIYAEFGILPIFQHLYWGSHDIPYKFYLSDQVAHININDIFDIQDHIAGLPIQKYYDMKDDIRVEAFDTITILRDIFTSGVVEFHLYDLGEFIKPNLEEITSLSKNDKYIIDSIYWGFVCLYWPMFTPTIFAAWLSDNSILASQFPDLAPSREAMINQFKLEAQLTRDVEPLDEKDKDKKSKDKKDIKSKIKVSVTSAILNVNNYGSSKQQNIYIRGLFDLFELSPTVDYCIAVIAMDLQIVVLKKVYTQNSLLKFADLDPHIDRHQVGSISYRIRLGTEDGAFIVVTFFENGNYVIRTNWREERGYSFSSILKTVSMATNPVVLGLNKVLSTTIPQMSAINTKFTEVGLSLFWDDHMSDGQFRALRLVLEEFNKAGILVAKLAESGDVDYYFSKGMYVFDIERLNKALSISNHYEYLSSSTVKQKWYNIFEKTHIMSLKHRSSDVMITMTGVKEQEYETFMSYIYVIFDMYAKTKPVSSNIMKHQRALVENKEQDPEFYNTKNIYRSEFIYSRVCQKPYQPRILNDTEYDELPEGDKKRALRFWNFTKKIPVWYFCPQKRFPYVRFITNKHPLGNCVPCCKINPVSTSATDPKRIIHDICMKNHVYLGDKKTVTSSSRYIMTYGKDIEVDRLCRLPEHTMEPLFLDLLTSVPVDQECAMGNRGYYLYGVSQHTPRVNNVGILFCLAKALSYMPDVFIAQTVKRIKDPANIQKFEAIRGDFPFASISDLVGAINGLWDSNLNAAANSKGVDYHWNDIFEKIGYHYFAINIVMFTAEAMKCTLRVPGYLKAAEDLLPESHQHLIVIKRHNIYNPIFLINTSLFFITKDIERKLFANSNELVAILNKLVRSILPSRNDQIDLNLIKRFASGRGWKIGKIYCNRQNYAFAVELEKGGKTVVIPVQKSFYSGGIVGLPKPCDLKNIINFTNEYNLWVADLSLSAGLIKRDIPKTVPLMQRVEPMYPYITPNTWVSYKGSIIAFKFQGLHFYHSPVKSNIALKIAKVSIVTYTYHPNDINQLILDQQEKQNQPKEQIELNEALYSYYEYQLFILAFLAYVKHTHRDTSVRKKIKSIMLKSKVGEIQRQLSSYTDKQLSIIVNKFVAGGQRAAMIAEFEERTFTFDTPSTEQLVELAKDTKKYTVQSSEKIKSFPRILADCNSAYCKDSRLIVRPGRVTILLDALLKDLQNPFKGPVLMGGINDRTLSFFDFIKRSFEIINIEFRSLYKN